MCVIAAKPKGVEMPDKEIIKQMWDSNKDGAGLMWLNNDNKVQISKGYMQYEDFIRQVDSMGDLTDVPVVMHFRITTHGGTVPENTHPFPVSDNIEHLKALDLLCNLGMVHNGVINTVPKEDDNSDTQIYIRDVLTPLSRIATDNFLEQYKTLVNTTISGSRLAFLDTTGTITLFGNWQEHVDAPGVKFSNLLFKPYVPKQTVYTYNLFEDGEYYVVDSKYTQSYIVQKHKIVPNHIFQAYSSKGAYGIGNTQYLYNYDTNESIEARLLWPHVFRKATDDEIDFAINALWDSETTMFNEQTTKTNENKHNIGGRKNQETAQIKMNADRNRLHSTFEERLHLRSIKPGTILEGYDVTIDDFYDITITSDNWYHNPYYDEIIYMQKDGTLIVVPELQISVNILKTIKYGVDIEFQDTLLYFNNDAYWRKGLI